MEHAYYYYADTANRPVGPLAAEQLHALVQVGRLSPETNVWKEGTTHWQPYRHLFPPPVHIGAMTLPTLPGPPPIQPTTPWYKRTDWSLVLFCFFSPVMLPLMWYWRLYTRKVRLWVTVGFAGLLLLVVVVGTTEQAAIQREFDEKKEQLLTQVDAAADAHDYAQVVRLDERYEFVHNPQLDTYLHTARAGLKAAAEKERIEKAAAAPVTSWSHLTKAQWKDKAARSFGWFPGVPLQAPAARFQEVMGKPGHTKTVGGDVLAHVEVAVGFFDGVRAEPGAAAVDMDLRDGGRRLGHEAGILGRSGRQRLWIRRHGWVVGSELGGFSSCSCCKCEAKTFGRTGSVGGWMPSARRSPPVKRAAYKNAVGPVVRRLRNEHGWTQEEFAVKLQVLGWTRCTRGWLSRIEARLVAVRDYELTYLCKALRVTLPTLFPSLDPRKADPTLGQPAPSDAAFKTPSQRKL